MRRRYLVCYDVSHPRRLARTYKTMNGFGTAVQYSVFVCDLTDIERLRLEHVLVEILNLNEDRVLIVDLGQTERQGDRRFKTLGRARALPTRGTVVV
jgi:CRISPR-associated protein Cas2